MKMRWEEPKIEVQMFMPNEYVAACYYGNCNISGEVFMDTNHNGQYDVDGDEYKYTNDACGHYFSVTGQDSPQPQANAFVVDLDWVWDGLFQGYWEVRSATPVYNFDNVHVATMDSIHTHERPNHS